MWPAARGEARAGPSVYAPAVRHVAPSIVFLVALGCSEFVERDAADTASSTADICAAACSEPGRVECDGAGRRVCVEVDGCATWRPAEACGEGLSCREGECGADLCPSDGALSCRDLQGPQRCGPDARGFLLWSPLANCAQGEICEEGACVVPTGGCPALGSRRCGGQGASVCKLVGGRLTWTEEPCGPGTDCRGAGVCGADACTQGVKRCDGELIASCVDDPSGFKVFGTAGECPEGGVCRDLAPEFAVPKAHCGVDACVADALRCNPGPERCAPDELGFLVWRAEPDCADGQECRDGVCGADGCPAVGVGECVPEGLRICADVAGFLAWSEPAPCVDAVCVGGACVQNGCAGVGATKCADETHAALCKLDESTGLLQWGPPVPCPGQGSVCRVQGVCGKDACPSAGAVQCNDDTSTAVCQFGSGPFLVWGPGDACEPGDTCRTGFCGHDECVIGSVECVDTTTRRECVDAGTVGGTPGFGVWADAVACEHPDHTCVDGACVFEGSFELLAAADSADVVALPGGGFGVLAGDALTWRTYTADGLLKGAAALNTAGAKVRATAAPGAVFGLWFDPEGALQAAALSPPGAPFALPALFPLSAQVPALLFTTSEGPYAVRVEGTDTGDRIVASPLSSAGVVYTVEVAANDAALKVLAAAPTASGAAAFAWTTAADPASLLVRRLDLAGGAVSPVFTIPAGLPVVGVALAGAGESGLVIVEQQGALSVTGVNFDDNDLNGTWSPVVLGERPVLQGDAMAYRVKVSPEQQQLWFARVGPGGLLSSPRLVDEGATVSQARISALGAQRWVLIYLRDGSLRARFEEEGP